MLKDLMKRSSDKSLDSKSDLSSDDRKSRSSKEVFVEIPLAHLRRLITDKELGSYDRETHFFTDITTMHGPLRVYTGRGWAGYFWGLIMILSLTLLVIQIVSISSLYLSKPVVSQVSFLIEREGLDFPVVTVCNFNPIKKSFIEMKNATGEMPEEIIHYLIQANVEMQTLYSNAHIDELREGDQVFRDYVENVDPKLNVDSFFYNGGFECPELFKQCSFGGRKFDCCKLAKPVPTPLGRCFSLNLYEGPKWLRKQTAAGEMNGLQLILDAHLEEWFAGAGGEQSDPVFTNAFENGFRYFIHHPDAVSFVASEGISVSPSQRAYSSIAATQTELLPEKHWGTCIDKWPEGYTTDIKYSSANCAMLCKAKFYMEKCGCVPIVNNLDSNSRSCTPLEMYDCAQKMTPELTEDAAVELPKCEECEVECSSWQYHSYNSYGYGFSDGATQWLHKMDPNSTTSRIRKNVLAVSIFFKELTYTQFSQEKGTSLTETLSDIGGNMGLCFGMSVITIMEILSFLTKIGWITISKNRRHYLNEKKLKEKVKEEVLEEVASTANLQRKIRQLKAKHLEEVQDKAAREFSNSVRELVINQRLSDDHDHWTTLNEETTGSTHSEDNSDNDKLSPSTSQNGLSPKRVSRVSFPPQEDSASNSNPLQRSPTSVPDVVPSPTNRRLSFYINQAADISDE